MQQKGRNKADNREKADKSPDLKPAHQGLPKKEYLPLALIVIMFAIASFSYHYAPDKMPSHWNAKGDIDGYSGRLMGLFLLPAIAFMMYIIISIIPYIAVYRENIKSFYFYIYLFKIVFLLFLMSIYIITLLFSFGVSFNINYAIVPLFSVLIYFTGILMSHAKRNYFIGIRTPWTLASEAVWDKTHKLGSKGFKIIAVIALASMFFSGYYIFFMIVPLLGFSVYLAYYSYREYEKEIKIARGKKQVNIEPR
jgi:uncharacterized membrane protein